MVNSERVKLSLATKNMLDLIFILAIIGFFMLVLFYMRGCENLREGDSEK